MIINDLDDYYIVFDAKNRNTELDTLIIYSPTDCTDGHGFGIFKVALTKTIKTPNSFFRKPSALHCLP